MLAPAKVHTGFHCTCKCNIFPLDRAASPQISFILIIRCNQHCSTCLLDSNRQSQCCLRIFVLPTYSLRLCRPQNHHTPRIPAEEKIRKNGRMVQKEYQAGQILPDYHFHVCKGRLNGSMHQICFTGIHLAPYLLYLTTFNPRILATVNPREKCSKQPTHEKKTYWSSSSKQVRRKHRSFHTSDIYIKVGSFLFDENPLFL